MSLLNRLTSTLSAKANELLDRFDDPKAAIENAYQRLFDELGGIQRAESQLDEARRALLRRSEELEQCAAELETEAQAAAASGRADLAREALARRVVLRSGVASLGAEESELKKEDDRIDDAATILETKLPVLRTQMEALKAAFVASGNRTEIDDAIVNLDNDRAAVAAAARRAEERAGQLRAQAARIDALVAPGAVRDLSWSPGPIEREVAAARHSIEVDRELASIEQGLT
jgi:phage shock protein A